MKPILTQRSNIAHGREELAYLALQWGADWVLFQDSDHTFPADTLLRLLATGHKFIGCNQPRRTDPTGPTAWRRGKPGGDPFELVWTTAEDAKAGQVEEVALLGMGLCLVAAEVFRATPQPWFWWQREPYELSEDGYFCEQAAKAGFPPHVDHGLSWEVGHLHQVALTNLHAAMDKARFRLANKIG